MMDRINELIQLFCKITNMNYNGAKNIILSTSEGKAILDGNESVLYEQVTENLYQIGRELNDNRFTVENIVKAYNS